MKKKKEVTLSLSHPVEVTDTLTNIKSDYSSKAEAARAIKCSPPAIHLALKEFHEKGVHRLTKKRYVISFKENPVAAVASVDKSIGLCDEVTLNKTINSNTHRVKVLDLLGVAENNTTIYLSLNEAAIATGCHVTTISKALKSIGEKDD